MLCICTMFLGAMIIQTMRNSFQFSLLPRDMEAGEEPSAKGLEINTSRN